MSLYRALASRTSHLIPVGNRRRADWSCSVCTLANAASSSSCVACGTQYSVSAAATTDTTTTITTGTGSDDGRRVSFDLTSNTYHESNSNNNKRRSVFVEVTPIQWICETCTFLNPPAAASVTATCTMCNAVRPSSKIPQPDSYRLDVLVDEGTRRFGALFAVHNTCKVVEQYTAERAAHELKYASIGVTAHLDRIDEIRRDIARAEKRLHTVLFENVGNDPSTSAAATHQSQVEALQHQLIQLRADANAQKLITLRTLTDARCVQVAWVEQLGFFGDKLTASLKHAERELANVKVGSKFDRTGSTSDSVSTTTTFPVYWLQQQRPIVTIHTKFVQLYQQPATAAAASRGSNSDSKESRHRRTHDGKSSEDIRPVDEKVREEIVSYRRLTHNAVYLASGYIHRVRAILDDMSSTRSQAQELILQLVSQIAELEAIDIDMHAASGGGASGDVESACEQELYFSQLQLYGIKEQLLRERKQLARMKYELELLELHVHHYNLDSDVITRGRAALATQIDLINRKVNQETELQRRSDDQQNKLDAARRNSSNTDADADTDADAEADTDADTKRPDSSSSSSSSTNRARVSDLIPIRVHRTGLVVKRSLRAYSNVQLLPRQHRANDSDAASADSDDKTEVTVFRAQLLDRTVALKRISLTDSTGVSIFENEILARRTLQHPVVEPIEAVFQAGTFGYIQMRFHSRGNLRNWLDQNPPPKVHELQTMFQQLLLGLDFIHEQNVVHRNINPENILITTDGSPVFVDFGLAKMKLPLLQLSLTRLQSDVVNPLLAGGEYVAPEVQNGEPSSSAADVWAIGIIMFRCFFNGFEPIADPQSGSVAIPAHDNPRLRDLLSSMLQLDAHCRPGTETILRHPYFIVSAAQQLYDERLVMDRNVKFNMLNKWIEKQQRHSIAGGYGYGHDENKIELHLTRGSIVSSTIVRVSDITARGLRQPWTVVYSDAKGHDDGGLTDDLFVEFFARVLDSDVQMFESAPAEDCPISGATYLPCDHNDAYNAYRIVGKLMCKILLDQRAVPMPFATVVFKFILGIDPTLQDLEMYDRTRAMNLRRLLTLQNVQDLQLDFDGLQSNGASVLVTDSNKHEYLRKVVQHELVNKRIQQLRAIRDGFCTVAIPPEIMNMLAPTDLMMVLCGNDTISPVQVINLLRFSGFGSSDTPQLLVEYISGLKDPDLRRFLRLATAKCSLPTLSTEVKHITIQAGHDSSSLPVGHTCTHTLDMPDYHNMELLKNKMDVALSFVDSSGFDFV
jgi:serine/threonine protein kinase